MKVVIIPYQVITGNYNAAQHLCLENKIIPYQVITGNYNLPVSEIAADNIIPYQVITGNYNVSHCYRDNDKLYHTK